MSVRCTPFCRPCDKGYKHHELLLALLNTRDVEQGCFHERDHDLLKCVIKKYQAKGWDIDTEIAEDNEEFRFPLLHWACVLGKIRTVRWLLDYGFSSTVQTKDTQETCVHRALMTLPDITLTKNGRQSMLRFESLLPYFRDCLVIGNHRQNTPLHVAAHFIVQNRCFKLYENLFEAMLNEIKKLPWPKQNRCVNAQNCSGDTVLNLLASGCKSLTVIEKLLDAGADSMIVNKLNIGPLDNAQRHGLVHIANFLKSSLLRGCGVIPPANQHKNSSLLHDESRKRRSERRSTYNSTMSSLSMFCQEDANNSLGSTEQPSSPSKGSEKSNNEPYYEPEDEGVTEDETSSQSSSILPNDVYYQPPTALPNEIDWPSANDSDQPPASLANDNDQPPASSANDNDQPPTMSDNDADQPPIALDNDADGLPTTSGHPTEAEQLTTPEIESRAFEPTEEVPIEIKRDDDSEICTCSEDENDNNIPIAINENVQDKEGAEVKLFDVMKEAGVLENLADVIARTKDGHVNRMTEIDKSLLEMDEKAEEARKDENRIRATIERRKREIERLTSELYNLRQKKKRRTAKRKRIQEERQDLRKKLVCCETLIKTVPKDT